MRHLRLRPFNFELKMNDERQDRQLVDLYNWPTDTTLAI